ncbi:Alpha/Beta hydrolase protein [Dactylonectria macrodidyma]|uniref:Carboxylic ester hydrolase n=1 Tax=Dactylonectria macrodidyma TaxID=307937 RepID=A0A9P9J705_9HYPO|nr:Alpha/Beta hydrolase protein [Dactylonectria macrodidyma]
MAITMAQYAVLAASQIPLSDARTSSNSKKTIKLSGYGKFTGTVVNTTYSSQQLPEPVDAWLGIDYSTQPTGSGRFKAVDWPSAFKGVKATDTYGKACIQETTSSLPAASQDEACLNFNVYRTQGVPLSKKLPVLVWIHGGAFFSGSYKSFDGAAFVASSKEPIVVVNFHYRVNSLGFLPSALFEDEELLNLGIRDQHQFLLFVQKHISSFGGNPKAVTIGGRSAGAHSVGIHYFHNYGKEHKQLFARAIHQSGSVTSRAFPNASYPLYKTQYAEYLTYLGCDEKKSDKATLACLRSVDVGAIRTISTKIFYDYNPVLTWPFQPVAGGFLFEKPGSQSGYDGTFFHVPVISSTVTDEGKFYVPGTLETNEEFLDYLHNISPALNSKDLELLSSLYPDPATDATSPFANSPNSTQYNRLAAAWSDYAYICPGQETSYRASIADVPTWKLRFNTPAGFPAWQGIPHTSDTRYTWDEPTTLYPEISHIYHGYLSSFVAAGNPNKHRYPGSPKWPQYDGNADQPVQLVVQPEDTKVEKDNIRTEACLYWRDPERAPRLNK